MIDDVYTEKEWIAYLVQSHEEGGGGRGSGSGRWVECTQTLLLPWEVEMFFLIDPRLKEKHFKDGRNKK